jgi:hypothetical protein
MKPSRKQQARRAEGFLRELEASKGTVLTDEEYEGARARQLQTLAKPPRIEWVVAGPGLVGILVGIGFLVAAWVTWVAAPGDSTRNRLMIGLVLVGLGSLFFIGNLLACRTATRRPCAERKAEIDDLLRSGLITTQEHETVKHAIEDASGSAVHTTKI